ncbi:PAAR domain-containing protein [Pseudomonas chlororaphis]|uniref:PAAR domain-containing protein n=1 Tax=Pseudomonas chlororaphis TaxID=587753 RepID=UPI002408520B|nr:PAAR domain-containing protein [Pseudomonas chlororaphis]
MTFVIREGDPTTTGGRVLVGSTTTIVEHRKAARISDPVWCPQCNSMGFIAEGNPTFIVEGVAVATHGHAVQCGCPPGSNRLIATQSTVTAAEEGSVTIAPEFAAKAQAATHAWAQAISDGSYNSEFTRDIPSRGLTGLTSAEPLSAAPTTLQGVEPGFHIVQSVIPRSELEALLFEQPSAAVLNKFRSLNPQLSSYAKPGQLIVLSDPKNHQCTREEALLMDAANKVNSALGSMSDDEATFMVRHRAKIESFLTEGSGAIGIGEVMFSKHLENLKSTLGQLEQLHQRTFQQHGRLQTPEFFAERKRLMSQLDNSLGPLVRKGVGIPEHPKLKHALGISSRSLVHHWSKAGVPGNIPGYATHINGVAKASKYIKLGGWVGIGLGASASALKVREVCQIGREQDCRKVRFTEGGKFAGRLAGGAVGSPIGGAVCVALSATGIGGLLCGVVMVGLGSVAGGAVGKSLGEGAGEKVYEWSE